MRVGSLFSGIGGIDLGLERAGMTTIWQSEINPYASRVLAKHWPHVPNLGDITAIDWSTVERPDLVCGGYPCQPFSFAGRRAGTDDPRHLWPHFATCLRVLRPEWALLENVPGHLNLGFDEVLADLAALGFDAEWELLPAAAFGAPHLRYRLIVVAHSDLNRQPSLSLDAIEGQGFMVSDADHPRSGTPRSPVDERRSPSFVNRDQPLIEPRGHGTEVADADEIGRGRWTGMPGAIRRSESSDRREDVSYSVRGSSAHGGGGGETFGEWTTDGPGDCRAWAVEPDVGRVADGVPRRVDRLRGLGNAVVPQLFEWVGRQIMAAQITDEGNE